MASVTTTTAGTAWAPSRVEHKPGDVIPDALILQTSMQLGMIHGDDAVITVPWVKDDGTAYVVNEAAAIPSIDQIYSQTTLHTRKVATLGAYSREIMEADGDNRRMISDGHMRTITRKANALYLTNNTPELPGLFYTDDIVDGGEITTTLDPVVDAVALIEQDGGTATHIVASPTTWATLSKLKTQTGSALPLIGSTVSQPAGRQLLGLPVVVCSEAPAGHLLILDSHNTISASTGVRTALSEDAYFGNDMIGLRLTWRLGWAVQRPERIAHLTTADADPLP